MGEQGSLQVADGHVADVAKGGEGRRGSAGNKERGEEKGHG